MLSFDPAVLRNAALKSVAVDWATATCVVWLSRGTASGAVHVCITWHGITSLRLDRQLPFGESDSVLEARFDENGADTIHMQSGDVVTINAGRRYVEDTAEDTGSRYAGLAVDALVQAGIVERTAFDRASEIVAEEITVRRAMGDL